MEKPPITKDKEEITEEITNVSHIDDMRVERLAQNGVYWNLFDQFNTLEVKLGYGENLTPKEVREYCLLTKYLMKYGHSEAIQFKCNKIYERYMKEQGL